LSFDSKWHLQVLDKCISIYLQVLPRAFRPSSSQLFGFGLWAPVAVGGLFYMIGEPSVVFFKEQLGLKAADEHEGS
jgi:hypothetical protein